MNYMRGLMLVRLQSLCYNPQTLLVREGKRVMGSKVRRRTCPFTLELCEECCERKISGHQGICAFTLEGCHCYLKGCLHHTKK